MTITKADLLKAYADGRDRGQAEGLGMRTVLQRSLERYETRVMELEAQLRDVSRDLVNANRNAYEHWLAAVRRVLDELPPSGGLADGVKSESESEHGPARAADESVPWCDAKS